MFENDQKYNRPIVSVLISTFNRSQSLHKALVSVLKQSYENLQVIVINDGGEDVRSLINSFNDSRLIYINRKENYGKAYSLNEALNKAEGKYIAYLDDDDMYYPSHIEVLVDALENQTDCRVAYTDLYKVYCKVFPDGSRQVLSKVVEVSRDFDRFLMLNFNHVLHVSLMHRRDLIEKTGPYNEQLNILIDWDMTRRLVFFSDFYHVHEVTGEYSQPMGECDRISVKRRKDKNEYLKNLLKIRTTRPAKPWPKIDDLSIIFVTDKFDKLSGKTIGSIWHHTFYPYELLLPMSESDFGRLNTDMPNLIFVNTNPSSSHDRQVDTALERCEGEYIAIVPSGFPVKDIWIENPLYALINCVQDRQGFMPEEATERLWAVVLKKDDLLFARRNFSDLSVLESLKAAGISLRHPDYEEFPFQFDNLYNQARSIESEGDWLQAAQMYEYIADRHQNVLWMNALAARAFYEAGQLSKAECICHELNLRRPTVDTLLLEAKLKRQNEQFDSAIELLKSAENILQGQELIWT
jgi:glycosyltransferase involved in cell wall biosynthesis